MQFYHGIWATGVSIWLNAGHMICCRALRWPCGQTTSSGLWFAWLQLVGPKHLKQAAEALEAFQEAPVASQPAQQTHAFVRRTSSSPRLLCASPHQAYTESSHAGCVEKHVFLLICYAMANDALALGNWRLAAETLGRKQRFVTKEASLGVVMPQETGDD